MLKHNWQQNLLDAISLDPLVLVHGNVKDLFPVRIDVRGTLPRCFSVLPYVNFDVWLALELEQLGYSIVILYDSIDGAVALRGSMVNTFTTLVSTRPGSPSQKSAGSDTIMAIPAAESPNRSTSRPQLPKGTASAPVDPSHDWLVRLTTRQTPEEFFRALYENVLPQSDVPLAIVCRFINRYLSYSDRQDREERLLSLLIQKVAMAIPRCSDGNALESRVVLIFDTEGETPQELNVQAPFARSVLVPPPSVEEREEFFINNHALFDPGEPGDRFDPGGDLSHLRLVANLAEGLKTQDLISLSRLSVRERLGLGPRQVKTLMDRFKFGTRENAWLKVKPETLRGAKTILQKRVKGQDRVLDEVIPVLVRAKLGMTDPSGSPHSSKPRGTFFFVGPTGVGKTELSKAIAELIFGDDNATIRFDMSEYSEEHQQARLIGAPPGYVGFDQGGQLTNAIIERPFSVVLFDEIEKAHSRILDKFLQILDDGRLTDGMGRTVYFSEAILIFTSNLGTSPQRLNMGPQTLPSAIGGIDGGHDASVSDTYTRLADLPYEQLCEHFRAEVKDFFVNRLGRPEILNRIGEDNILVFTFLTDDKTKNDIIEQQIESLSRMLSEKEGIRLYCTGGFKNLLLSHPSGFLRNGARGVRNLLTRLVLNPLAEQLFQAPEQCKGKTFRADYRVAISQVSKQPFDQSKLNYEWIEE